MEFQNAIDTDRAYDDDPGDPIEVIPRDQTIWHYTTLQGVTGLLESRALWASSAAMLNDTTEMKYGIRVATHNLHAWLSQNEVTSAEQRYLEAALEAASNRMRANQIMVACASTEGDDLALWRGYSLGQGYAVGLLAEDLSVLDNTQIGSPMLATGFRWGKVVYSKRKQQQLVEGVIRRALWYVHGGQIRLGDPVSPAWGAEWLFSQAIAYMKHKGFASEREVRFLIDRPDHDAFDHLVKAHASPLGLTPHMELTRREPAPLGTYAIHTGPGASPLVPIKVPGWLPITHVRVGPGPNQKAAARGLKDSLRGIPRPPEARLTYHDVKVKQSKIPYR